MFELFHDYKYIGATYDKFINGVRYRLIDEYEGVFYFNSEVGRTSVDLYWIREYMEY